MLAVNKPAGLPVHRGTAHPEGVAEMVEAWVRLHPGVLDIAPGRRVRPVHRLDREASGVLLLALTTAAARKLHAAFASHEVAKTYFAVVAGPLEAEGRLRGKVRSKLRGTYRKIESELTFRRIRGDERLSLVEVTPTEGRTHQIRSLFARAGRPLAGDLRYGKPTPSRQFLERFSVPFFLLHARAVSLPQGVPGGGKTVQAPVPAEFHRIVSLKNWEPLDPDA